MTKRQLQELAQKVKETRNSKDNAMTFYDETMQPTTLNMLSRNSLIELKFNISQEYKESYILNYKEYMQLMKFLKEKI